ncbi:MFS transporter [Ferrovibrio xuzhouensis]|uniref:MFS transporter n=1 Tax=Ferrovibrio xuzhouensis TaxID=1576914 RepID=A0ABV7VIX6_9PROT
MLPAIFLTVVVDLIGFGLILPLLPFYAGSFGASPFVIALLAAVFSIAQFLAAPLLGALSDRFGRKPVFLLCTALTAGGYLTLAFAQTLTVIFIARTIAGIGAGKIGIAQAIIADATPPEKRARGMGLVGAAFGIGMILGPVLGGLLVGPDPLHPNYHLPAFAAAGASLTALLLAVLTIRETLTVPLAARAGLRIRHPLAALPQVSRAALAFILINGVINFVFAQVETLFPLFTAARLGWHAYEVGIAFTFIGVVVLTMQGVLIGPLTRRFGESRLLAAGILALALGTVMTEWVFAEPVMGLSILLTAGGFGMINPSIASLISRSAGEGHVGLTMGVSQSMSALGRVVGPVWGGLLFEQAGITSPYLVGGAILLLTLIAGWRHIRLPQPAGAAP